MRIVKFHANCDNKDITHFGLIDHETHQIYCLCGCETKFYKEQYTIIQLYPKMKVSDILEDLCGDCPLGNICKGHCVRDSIFFNEDDFKEKMDEALAELDGDN